MEQKLNRLSGEMNSYFSDLGIDFGELLDRVLEGNLQGAFLLLTERVGERIAAELAGMKNLILMLLLIGILSAVCMVLMQTFQNKQIADVAHFVAYLLMLSVVITVFLQAVEKAEKLLERILLFVRILVPTFMVALGFASGSVTAYGYYQLLLLVLYAAQRILEGIGLPAVKIFLILHVMNGIWDEERLSGLVELMKKGIVGAMKIFLTTVAGIGLLQSMITPVIERIRFDTTGKMLSSIPGLGGLAEGTAQLLLGSAVLVKNGLGVTSILLLAAICLLPFLQIFLWAAIFKVCAGLIGLVADKRLIACVNGAGDALFLILRILFTAGGCFLVMFAIITSLAGTAG